jgi:hypothetical protein
LRHPIFLQLLIASFATLFAAVATQAAELEKSPAVKLKKYVVPKTEFGQPDLRGVWNFSSDTPMERPARFKDREFMTREEWEELHNQRAGRAQENERLGRGLNNGPVGGYNEFWNENLGQHPNLRTSLVIDPPDGRLPPFMPGVKSESGGLGPDTGGPRPVRFRVGGAAKNGPEDRGLSERCIVGFNSGPPFMPGQYNNNVQIFQTKNTAVIMTEMIHDARVVPLDNQTHVDATITPWSGDSRGHWEGNTLVVDTTNFSDKVQSFRSAGTGKTLHLIERFVRVGKDRVDYQFTIDDPMSFTAPITALVPMVRADGDLYEYACHEGNYGLPNTLSGARQEEREAAGKKRASD